MTYDSNITALWLLILYWNNSTKKKLPEKWARISCYIYVDNSCQVCTHDMAYTQIIFRRKPDTQFFNDIYVSCDMKTENKCVNLKLKKNHWGVVAQPFYSLHFMGIQNYGIYVCVCVCLCAKSDCRKIAFNAHIYTCNFIITTFLQHIFFLVRCAVRS